MKRFHLVGVAAFTAMLGGAAMAADEARFELTIRDHRFEPAELTVPADVVASPQTIVATNVSDGVSVVNEATVTPVAATPSVTESGNGVVEVPVITPALDKVKPAGNVPALSDHVNGAVPPDAASVVDGYAVPTVPLGRVDVVMVGGVGAALMTICSGFVANRLFASVTFAAHASAPSRSGASMM